MPNTNDLIAVIASKLDIPHHADHDGGFRRFARDIYDAVQALDDEAEVRSYERAIRRADDLAAAIRDELQRTSGRPSNEFAGKLLPAYARQLGEGLSNPKALACALALGEYVRQLEPGRIGERSCQEFVEALGNYQRVLGELLTELTERVPETERPEPRNLDEYVALARRVYASVFAQTTGDHQVADSTAWRAGIEAVLRVLVLQHGEPMTVFPNAPEG